MFIDYRACFSNCVYFFKASIISGCLYFRTSSVVFFSSRQKGKRSEFHDTIILIVLPVPYNLPETLFLPVWLQVGYISWLTI